MLTRIKETPARFEDASRWDDAPFALGPLPFWSRLSRALADFMCLIGMAVAKALRVLRAVRKPVAPQKILVIRRGGLGDVLMATPLLRALRQYFPSAYVCVLASRQAIGGLDACPWVDRVCELPASMRGWLPLLYRLRKEKFDTAFILHRFFLASLVTLWAGIPQRLGFSWKNHGFALTGSIPFSAATSQTVQIGQLLTLLGAPAATPEMEFTIGEDAILRALEVLAGWGFDPARPLVGLHPGGGETPGYSDQAKRWLPERFGGLADLLVQNSGIQVVLLEGPEDEPFVRETLKNMKARALGIASGLPLTVFAALIKKCDLVVVNDTGPMHIAAAQQVPVVAIIGPTHPAYTPPRGGRNKVIWAGVPCSPCYNPEETIYCSSVRGKKVFECWRSTHECMTAITAEEVYDVVIRQIKEFDKQSVSSRLKVMRT